MKLILVLLLILAMCFGVMHSCDFPLSLSFYRYEHADRYTAGSCTLYDDVQRIEIDWISGNVTVQYHNEDYIAVSETASRTLDKDNLLHYWLDGDTLRVRFAKSGRHSTAALRNKDLTLLLPRDTALRVLSVETVSADMHLQDITADCFDLDSVSGSMELLDVYFADEMGAESVSGAITVAATGNAGSLDAETVSGDIFAAAESFQSIDLDSTSGHITAEADSLSGESNLESTSGRIELRLADDGFTARTSTLSGRFESNIPYNKADGVYLCGSGGPEIDIETTSGNVSIFTKG